MPQQSSSWNSAGVDPRSTAAVSYGRYPGEGPQPPPPPILSVGDRVTHRQTGDAQYDVIELEPKGYTDTVMVRCRRTGSGHIAYKRACTVVAEAQS